MCTQFLRLGCFVALLYFATLPSAAHATTTTENFGSDPGWSGNNNTGFGTNNYGYRGGSNFAGGAVGEAGGAVASRTNGTHTWYADDSLGGSFTLTDPFESSGRFTINSLIGAFDGGFELGFFNFATPTNIPIGGGIGGIEQGAGIRFVDENATTLRSWARLGNNEASASPILLTVGTDYLYDIQYDPIGGGAGIGKLDVEYRLAADNSLVGASSLTIGTGTPWSLNGFGISTLQFGSNNPAADFFIDDVSYSIVPEPSALVLVAIGIATLAVGRRRHGRKSHA